MEGVLTRRQLPRPDIWREMQVEVRHVGVGDAYVSAQIAEVGPMNLDVKLS
jgi:hypothetical protein